MFDDAETIIEISPNVSQFKWGKWNNTEDIPHATKNDECTPQRLNIHKTALKADQDF